MQNFIRLRLLFGLLLLGLFFLIYKIGLVILPYSPVSMSTAEKMKILTVLPEGWAFFTKDPRGDVIYIYKKVDGICKLVNIPGSSAKFCFGLNRKGRAIGPELARLLGQIADSTWENTNSPVDSLLKNWNDDKRDTRLSPVIYNKCPDPACVGKVFLLKTKLIPWAWARSPHNTRMPSQFTEVNVYYAKPN